MNNKKGVSPLVAAMLLIVIAVSLGTIVFTWSRNYTKTTTSAVSENFESQFKCDLNVGTIGIVELNSTKKVCYSSNNSIVAKVENRLFDNSYAVRRLFVRVTLENGSSIANYADTPSMKVAEVVDLDFPYAAEEPEQVIPIQVKIFPVLRIANKDQICVKSGVVIDEIFPCRE